MDAGPSPLEASAPTSPSGQRVTVLTGPTSGIGQATARALAPLGGSLVLVGRRPEALRSVAEELKGRNPALRVELHTTDLSELRQVRRMAERIRSDHPRVDVLINNAGAYFHRREATSEGVERTFALNVLAPLLLSRVLEGPLRAGAPSRVVMVSSAAHRAYRLRLEDLEASRGYSGFAVYGRSKLALLQLTYALAEQWRTAGIDVNAMHPGFVATRFGHNNPGLTGYGMAFLTKVFGRSPERGAATEVLLASSPGLRGVTGQYYIDGAPSRSSSASYDRTAREALVQYCDRRLQEVLGESEGDPSLPAGGVEGPFRPPTPSAPAPER